MIKRINEKQFHTLIKECVKKALSEIENNKCGKAWDDKNYFEKATSPKAKGMLKESMDVDTFKSKLQERFHEILLNIFNGAAEKFCDEGEEWFEDTAMEMAETSADYYAEKYTADSIKVLSGSDWDIPKNNFRPLDYVMKTEYGVRSFEELLEQEEPVEIYIDWFFDAFGTFGIEYNFNNTLSEEFYSLNQEDDDEENSEETQSLNESTFRGVEGTKYIDHGVCGDPEIVYNGKTYNYWEIEDALWQEFKEEGGSEEDGDEAFDRFCQENAPALFMNLESDDE